MLQFIYNYNIVYENGQVTVNKEMLASRYREEQAEYIAEGINVLYTEDNI